MSALVRVAEQDPALRAAAGASKPGVARFVTLEQIIVAFSAAAVPGLSRCIGQGSFRVIRDSDIEVEEEAEDLVRFFESALKRRRRGSVIRLEIDASMPEALRAFVTGDSTSSPPTSFVIDGMLALERIVASSSRSTGPTQVQAL